jgi:hypothetical protein
VPGKSAERKREQHPSVPNANRDPTAPEDPGPILPEPEFTIPEPELAAATATTNVWTTKAPMPTARAQLAAGVVNGVLYAVVGSTIGDSALTKVEAYTLVTNAWATKAPLPSPRKGLNVTDPINGVLYVAGGLNSGGVPTTTLFAYTLSINRWTTNAPMRAGLATTPHRGRSACPRY